MIRHMRVGEHRRNESDTGLQLTKAGTLDRKKRYNHIL